MPETHLTFNGKPIIWDSEADLDTALGLIDELVLALWWSYNKMQPKDHKRFKQSFVLAFDTMSMWSEAKDAGN